MKTALAVFVKTPELSPVKTRLGAVIGNDNARRFYDLSLASISDLLRDVSREDNVSVFWAVAEAGARKNKIWNSFPAIYQGEGSLGQRLDKIYRRLIEDFDAVILLGADSPQLSAGVITQAIDLLRTTPVVIGPANDGGFYLFAGTRKLPSSFWTSIPYSRSNTLAALLRQLPDEITPAVLSPMHDVDHREDLPVIIAELRNLDRSSAHRLADWIEAYLTSAGMVT